MLKATCLFGRNFMWLNIFNIKKCSIMFSHLFKKTNIFFLNQFGYFTNQMLTATCCFRPNVP